MIVKLFDKEIKLTDNYCSVNNGICLPIDKPYINLYVRFKGCNATCKFCNYQSDANVFNEQKYQYILKHLKENIYVKKIAFTGGEPTLNMSLFKNVLLSTNDIINTFILLNTNGFNLIKVFDDNDILSNIDNISLSKHHYNDDLNSKILGFNALKTEDLRQIMKQVDNRFLMHLACNLIKYNIDNINEVYKYLEYASQLNISSVGFVSLMNINEYCNNHFIKFSDFEYQKDDRLFVVKQQNNENFCKCFNYRYIPNDANKSTIRVYTKNHISNTEISNNLVFDGEYLRYGFSNNIIY